MTQKCIKGHPILPDSNVCEQGHSMALSPSATSSNHGTATGSISLSPQLLQQIISTAVQAATSGNSSLNESRSSSQAEKPKRPVITSGLTQERWSYFTTKWHRYKIMTRLSDSESVSHLIECCDDDLQMDLHRLLGADIINQSENYLLAEIKKLAVKEENTLISRTILRGMIQSPDEDIKHFAARIKGQADICKYTVNCNRPECNAIISYAESEIKDQICKGLADPDIQQELLSCSKQDMSLPEVINFVSTREAGKRSHNALTDPATLNKISPYQKNKKSNKKYN